MILHSTPLTRKSSGVRSVCCRQGRLVSSLHESVWLAPRRPRPEGMDRVSTLSRPLESIASQPRSQTRKVCQTMLFHPDFVGSARISESCRSSRHLPASADPLAFSARMEALVQKLSVVTIRTIQDSKPKLHRNRLCSESIQMFREEICGGVVFFESTRLTGRRFSHTHYCIAKQCISMCSTPPGHLRCRMCLVGSESISRRTVTS